jgi:sarcosine oxidase subunit gamma
MSDTIIGYAAGIGATQVAARIGVKGAGAAAWLRDQGVAVPAAANRITRWSDGGGGRCLRLGHSEFLVEHDTFSAFLPNEAGSDAWLLLRNDASCVLDGPRRIHELQQVCAFDFERFREESDLVVMTLLAGISVTLVREPRAAATSQLALRLWCDASYFHYLQQCLHALHSSFGESR